jgi:hypothetical protein
MFIRGGCGRLQDPAVAAQHSSGGDALIFA